MALFDPGRPGGPAMIFFEKSSIGAPSGRLKPLVNSLKGNYLSPGLSQGLNFSQNWSGGFFQG